MSEESKDASTFVKLVSAEGHEFFVDRNVAISASKTIRTMLEGQFREAQDNVIHFPEISNYILERVLQYLYYQSKVSAATFAKAGPVRMSRAIAPHAPIFFMFFILVLEFNWENP